MVNSAARWWRTLALTVTAVVLAFLCPAPASASAGTDIRAPARAGNDVIPAAHFATGPHAWVPRPLAWFTAADTRATVAQAVTNGAKSAAKKGVTQYISVVDRKTGKVLTETDNAGTQVGSESVMKLFIAAYYLVKGGGPDTTSSSLKSRLSDMIRYSDDDTADALYRPTIVPTIADRYHLDETAKSTTPGQWGATRITAHDMTKFLLKASNDPLVGPWLLPVMAHGAATASDGFNQLFGIGALTGHHGFKQGWGCDTTWFSPPQCSLNSVGYTSRYFIAILQTSPHYYPSRATATHTATLIASSLPSPAALSCGSLKDVSESSPLCTDIGWMIDQGLVAAAGIDLSGNAFHPGRAVTRAQMALMLYDLKHPSGQTPAPCVPSTTGQASAPEGGAYGAAPYSDVDPTAVGCGAIAWAAGAHITRGYDDGTYRPTAPVTRGAMAAYLARVVRASTPACTAAPFSDVRAGSTLCAAIAWAARSGVTNGYDDGTYRPTSPVSRAAMAAFLHRVAPDIPHDLVMP